MKKSTKILLGIAAVWWLTRPKKADTVPGSLPPGTPKPLTKPQSNIVDPDTGAETPVSHDTSNIEVRSTDPTPSGPPASAPFSATSD